MSLFGDVAGVTRTAGTLLSIAALVDLYCVAIQGVSGGSVKVIQDLLVMFGIPSGVIEIILPMDRPPDMSRSAVNVSGDLFTAGVTDRLCRGDNRNGEC
jgi:Na+/H+-dicarboxylate symporter